MNLTEIFLKIVSMSITASYCVLLICIARFFLRRAPKLFSYLLWSIVALRLVCPISVESSFSMVDSNLSMITGHIESVRENFRRDNSGYDRFSDGICDNNMADSSGINGSNLNGCNIGSGDTGGNGLRIGNSENGFIYSIMSCSNIDGIRLNYGNTDNSLISNSETDGIGFISESSSDAGAPGSNHGNASGNVTAGVDSGSDGLNGGSTATTGLGGDGLNDNSITGTGLGSDGLNDNSITRTGLGSDNLNGGSTAADDSGSIQSTVSKGNLPHSLLTAAACLWLSGMLGMFGYCILSYLRLYRRLKEKASYTCRYKGIPVYHVRGLDTPFAAGFTKPTIYLPTELAEEEARQCLAHEYTHIRRKDHIIKQASFLLVCIYWFQPLIWLAFHLMSKDMEMSCDEMTLRKADLEERKAYSSTLVRLSSGTHRFSGYPLAFSENSASTRIRNILNQKKPTAWILVGCSVLLLLFGAGLLTNPIGPEESAANPSHSLTETSGDIPDDSLGGNLLYDPPVYDNPSPDSRQTASGYDSPSPDNRQMPSGYDNPSPDSRQTSPMIEESEEEPYPAILQEFYPELQNAYREGNEASASELQLEMKLRMASYWTDLVSQQRKIETQLKQQASGGTGITEEQIESLYKQLLSVQQMAAQTKEQMDYMKKTVDAITGAANIVKAADYATAYPLSGVCVNNDTIVRSLPKESAPQIDALASGDTITVISFGRYMLQEDQNLADFLLSDTEIQQEYENFAVVLYHSETDNGRTTRKGYVAIDALDISGNAPETYMHWIGKTWSEAFCSQDGSLLYQMAADKKSFMKWEYIAGIHDTEPVQVEFNTSNPYPQQFYSVTLLTDRTSKSLAVSGMDDIALQFFVQTPEAGVWTQRQDLKIAATVRELQNVKHISDLLKDTVFFSEIRNYEQVTSCSEYRDAYLASPGSHPSCFDFNGSGYAALYCAEDNIIANTASYRYELDSAESILQRYLNLSGGNGEADTLIMRLRDDNNYMTGLIQMTFVEYTFDKADENGQNQITVPMYHDKYWYIWVPGQDEALDKIIYDLQEDISTES